MSTLEGLLEALLLVFIPPLAHVGVLAWVLVCPDPTPTFGMVTPKPHVGSTSGPHLISSDAPALRRKEKAGEL